MNHRFFRLLCGVCALILGVLLHATLRAAPEENKSVRYATDPRLGVLSIENGTLIVYRSQTEGQGFDQIELFRLDGVRLFSLNVLNAVPEAVSVGIWDVAVSPQGRVAVSAVFKSRTRASATLLLYGSDGTLANAVYLPPEREIRHLAFDSQERLWALGSHAGNKDPAAVPLIYKYDYTGKPAGQFIPRSEFPKDARAITNSPAKGESAFGVTDTEVWAFLPSSRKVVTMRKDGTGLRTFAVADPPWPKTTSPVGEAKIAIVRAFWVPPGKLIARVIFGDDKTYDPGTIYEWSAATNSWKLLPGYENIYGLPVAVTEEHLIIPSNNRGTGLELVWHPRP